jgi:hypothetical protein
MFQKNLYPLTVLLFLKSKSGTYKCLANIESVLCKANVQYINTLMTRKEYNNISLLSFVNKNAVKQCMYTA